MTDDTGRRQRDSALTRTEPQTGPGLRRLWLPPKNFHGMRRSREQPGAQFTDAPIPRPLSATTSAGQAEARATAPFRAGISRISNVPAGSRRAATASV